MEVKEESFGRRHQWTILSSSGLWLVLLTLLAAILRSIFLSKSLWLDEAWSAYQASVPLRVFLGGTIGDGYSNMALYHVFLHFWIWLAGSSEISLRAPSVIFATATVPLIYVVGKELFDTEAGSIAALLMAVNVTCVEFAQQARCYAMVEMMVTLATLLFLRATSKPSRQRCVAYTIVGGACAWLHLFGSLVFPAQFLALFAFPIDRKTLYRLIPCLAIIGLLSVPTILFAMATGQSRVAWIPPTTAKAVLRLFMIFAGACLYWGWPQRTGWVLFGSYLIAIAIAVFRPQHPDRPAVIFLLGSIALPLTITLVVSVFRPLFEPRYLLVCLPFFILLTAVGLVRIRPGVAAAAVVASMVALSLIQDRKFYDDLPLQDWRGAVNLMAGESKPGDVLIVLPEWNSPPAEYYINRLQPHPAFAVVPVPMEQLQRAAENDNPKRALSNFLFSRGVIAQGRIWILTDQQDGENPTIAPLLGEHQVSASRRLSRVSLFLIQ